MSRARSSPAEISNCTADRAASLAASLTVNGQPSTLLQRVYFDGPVLYQNIVTGAGELTFQDPAVAAFFDSFRFTEG